MYGYSFVQNDIIGEGCSEKAFKDLISKLFWIFIILELFRRILWTQKYVVLMFIGEKVDIRKSMSEVSYSWDIPIYE